MPDHDKDIDALFFYLKTGNTSHWHYDSTRFRVALTSLLAERDALIKQRDEALDLYNDLLNRLTGRKEGGGA